MSSSDCTAVGDDISTGTSPARIEHWNGTTWSVVPSPNAGPLGASLSSVSCTSASSCFAGGAVPTPNQENPTSTSLLERWDGSQWTIEPSPNGSGDQNVFESISCTSSSSCIATGASGSEAVRNFTQALAARWDGSSWTAIPPLASAGELGAVSCLSGTDCVAAGTTVVGSPANSTPVAERWDGANWTATGNPIGYVAALSCTAADQCVAVGQATTVGGLGTIGAQRWDGTGWTADTIPNPGDLAALSGVSCLSPTQCVAVGSYGNGVNIPLVEVTAGPQSSAPVVMTGGVSNVTASAAVLHGTVNPEGGPVSACVFQWGASDGPYTHSAPCSASPGSGSAAVPVSASLSGLVSGTSYEYRLQAANPSGMVTGAEQRFQTPSSGGHFTLGNPSLGDLSSTFQANLERVNPYLLYAAGTARSVSVYLQPTSTHGTQSLELMIYRDANGRPGAPLARTRPFVFKSSFAARWYTPKLTHRVSLGTGQYWIGVLTGGKSNVAGWRYDDTGTRDTRYTPFAGAPTNPFGATGSDTAVMSLYANLIPPPHQTTANARRARSALLHGHARLHIAKVKCTHKCGQGKPH